MASTNNKPKGKVVGVPLDADQLKRFHDAQPNYVATDAAWARQLIIERLEQIEAETVKAGAAA